MKKIKSTAILAFTLVVAASLSGCASSKLSKVNREIVEYNYTTSTGKIKKLKSVIRVPKIAGKKKAIVILHHGGGWSKGTTTQYAEYLENNGFVTFEPRMFYSRPRNIIDHLSQTFGALKYLSERKDVDKENISVMGLSYGGVLVIYSATQWANNKFSDGSISFKSRAAFYPLCGIHEKIIKKEYPEKKWNPLLPKDLEDAWIGSPMGIFSGENDDYDDKDPDACTEFVNSIPDQKQRSATSVITYPGATHGWDQGRTITYYSKVACKLKGCNNTNKSNPAVTAQAKEDLLKYLNSSNK